jgi:hypothetical protein
VNALDQHYRRRPEVYDVAAALDPGTNVLITDPKPGPRMPGMEQLKSWAMVEEGEKQL